jgi:hypothetical protein
MIRVLPVASRLMTTCRSEGAREMHFAYFDETKFEPRNPYFTIGGIIVPGAAMPGLEVELQEIQRAFFGTDVLSETTEIHARDVFHGKGVFKKMTPDKRVDLLRQVGEFIVRNGIQVTIVAIDVEAHRAKYSMPYPEYKLGLMLFLERVCDYLDVVGDIGMVYGDYEKDEVRASIRDFSSYKSAGKTPMYGRGLGRLVDTIYYTPSHHSRFLQVADVVVYLANRYRNGGPTNPKWLDQQLLAVWETVRSRPQRFRLSRWP